MHTQAGRVVWQFPVKKRVNDDGIKTRGAVEGGIARYTTKGVPCFHNGIYHYYKREF